MLYNEPLDCWSIANGENSRKYVLDILYYASRWTEKDIPRDSYISRPVSKFYELIFLSYLSVFRVLPEKSSTRPNGTIYRSALPEKHAIN